MKRIFDLIISGIGLIIFSPVLIPVIIIVWIQDWHSPFYIAPRVGKNNKIFNMVKLRSMIINADKSGVDSTSSYDKRITKTGKFIRKFKLDELTQLWNVLIGDMSLVGPRPNVKRETDIYTKKEKKILSVKPGNTDFSSIVFSDEGEILKDQADPDIAYNQLIRPWKSRLGLFYIKNKNLVTDLKLIFLTATAIISKEKALNGVSKLLYNLGANNELIEISLRKKELVPSVPPGANKIVKNREGRIDN
ncbi:MAG: sugar transferase [Mariniphaga sp.]|nr:sugar transferase [Mariniphaga sp.]